MLPLLALLLQAAPTPDVVVTGRRLETTAKLLSECVARHCPPDEDARATLAHAENEFVAGRYQDARVTLQDSINRNKRFAKAYPVPVSDLFRAHARIGLHLGEARLYHVGEVDSLVALKAGLPADDGRVLVQRIEVADSDARIGRAIPALDEYAAVAGDARSAKLPTVEGYARLRRVVLLTALAENDGGYQGDLRAAVNWFNDRPELAAFRTAAELISARSVAKKGDPAAIDAFIARYAHASARPQLLYAPVEVQQDSGRGSNGGSDTNALTGEDDAGQWVDISFWIGADGKVSDVDALRSSAKVNEAWVKPIKAAIAQRRYAPLALPKDQPGLLRVERYTRTADWTNTTRTRIRVRDTIPRVEMLDLTADPRPAPPSGD